MKFQTVLVQLGILLLSQANYSYTLPITTTPKHNPLYLPQPLPQCLMSIPYSFPTNLQAIPSTLSPRDVTQHIVHIRASNPSLSLRFFYCSDLRIQQAAITRTLYGALRSLTPRIEREGYNAPLGRPFTTEEERGINCVFTISDHDTGGAITVGAVGDVLRWMRRYMVTDGHEGSILLAVYMDEMKVATGQMRPRVDKPGVSVGSS